MSRYKCGIVAVLGFMAAMLFSCELEQEVAIPDHEPKLTLRLTLRNEIPDTSGHEGNLYIGRSQSVLDAKQELTGIDNATVRLYDEAGQLVELYKHTGIGLYHYTGAGYYEPVRYTIPEPGKVYRIEAAAPGYKTIESTIKMPAKTIVSEASFTDTIATDMGYFKILEGNLKVTIQDDRSEQNYYMIYVTPRDRNLRFMDLYYRYIPDETGGIIKQDKLRLGTVFSDELFQSGQIVFTSKLSVFSESKIYEHGVESELKFAFLEIRVEQLTRDEYLFQKTLQSQRDNDGNPFAEYTQVHSNVRNGYGVLGGVTITSYLLPVR